MGSKIGVMKIAATRLGLSFEEYLDKLNNNLKWCHICKQWIVTEEFGKDKSRGDGLSAVCNQCRLPQNTNRPHKFERRKMRKKGLAYCRKCQDWKPIDEIRNGLCRYHINEYVRMRYANDKSFREKRIKRSSSYKRGVKPIPPEAREILLEDSNNKCVYCGKPADSWDHIIPVSKGGKTTPGNIVPCCVSCNSSKKDKDVIKWMNKTNKPDNEMLYDRLCLAECGLYG